MLTAVFLYVTLQTQIAKNDEDNIELRFTRVENMVSNFKFEDKKGDEGIAAVAERCHTDAQWLAKVAIAGHTLDNLGLIRCELKNCKFKIEQSHTSEADRETGQQRRILFYSIHLSDLCKKIATSKAFVERIPKFSEVVKELESEVESLIPERFSWQKMVKRTEA